MLFPLHPNSETEETRTGIVTRMSLSSNNPNLMNCIRLCITLGFLPPESDLVSFITLENKPATQLLLATYPNLRVFLDYICHRWKLPAAYLERVSSRYVGANEQCRGTLSLGMEPVRWSPTSIPVDLYYKAAVSRSYHKEQHPPPPRKAEWRRMERQINNLEKELATNDQCTLEVHRGGGVWCVVCARVCVCVCLCACKCVYACK